MIKIDLSKFEEKKEEKDFQCRDLYPQFEPLSVEEQKLIYFMFLDALDELYAKKKNATVRAQISTYEMLIGIFHTCDFEKEIGASLKRVLLNFAKKQLEEWQKSQKKC
jgi:hypothetical protein